MMDHLDDGTMMALLDGELAGSDAVAARAHLGGCVTCETAMSEIRAALGMVASALSSLDRARSAPQDAAASVSPARSVRNKAYRFALPRAAVFLVSIAAAAAAAVPGSPVRMWIEARLGMDSGTAVTATAPRAEVAEAASEASERGIGVAPADGRFRVVVTGTAPSLPVRVVITRSTTGGAYALGDAPETRFSGRGGVIEVFDAVGQELRVEIPVAATDASLEIDGRTYVVKDGERLRLIGGAVDVVAEEVRFEVER